MSDENSTDQNGSGSSSNPTEREIAAVKVFIALGCIVLAVIFIVAPLIGMYNSLVDSDIQVQRAASNIKVDLERRADLLPNLAAEIQGSATFEAKTLIKVTEARAQANTIRSQIADTSASDTTALASKDEQLTSIYGNFVKLQEQYPELQTTQQFREFEAQTTATENEILADRQTYNAAVMQYQSIVRSFPTCIIADHFGFEADKYSMYVPANQTRAETVPTITFDFNTL